MTLVGGAAGGPGDGGEGGSGPVANPPCPALFFNLRRDQLSACFAHWFGPAVHRLQAFTVSSDGNWFSGFFVPGETDCFISLVETYQTFASRRDAYTALGWVPRNITVSQVGSQARFTAIWQSAESNDFVVVHEAASRSFDMQFPRWHTSGYTLTDWAIRGVPGLPAPLVTATWQRLPELWGGVAAYHSRSSAELDTMDADITRQGLVMTQLSAREDGSGQLLYNAIWRPMTFSTRWMRPLSPEELRSMQESQRNEGYSLYYLHAIDTERFTSVWRRD